MTYHEEQFIRIEDKLIGVDELVDSHIASKILGLSPRTIRDMASDGRLPKYKISGRASRFLVADLLEWCDERRVESSS